MTQETDSEEPKQENTLPQPPSPPRRRKLPDERRAITHKFSVAGHEGYVTAGLYDDGTPGGIYLSMAKEGSLVAGLLDAFAMAFSLALQYGVPLEVLVEKFYHMRFEPAGYTKNQEIPIVRSLIDYVVRWLASRFLSSQQKEKLGIVMPQPRFELPPREQKEDGSVRYTFQNSADAPECHECGSLMVKGGACYKCLSCGATSGCS